MSHFFGPDKTVSIHSHFEDIDSGLTFGSEFIDGEVSHVIKAEVKATSSEPDTEDYQLTMKADSPLFKPILAIAKLVVTDNNSDTSFEPSLSVRHGRNMHSIFGKYHQSYFDDPIKGVYSVVINMTSPYLPAEKNSIVGNLETVGMSPKIEGLVEMDMFNEQHSLKGYIDLTELETDNSKMSSSIKIDSKRFVSLSGSWNMSSECSEERFRFDTNINNPWNRIDINLSIDQFYNEEGWANSFVLTTPFPLVLDKISAKSAYNATGFFYELATSRPLTSLSLHHAFNESSSSFETSATLTTPLKNWKTLGFVANIPYYSSDSKESSEEDTTPDSDQYNTELLLMLALPKKQYLLKANFLLNSNESRLQSQIEMDLGGIKGGTSLLLTGGSIQQLKFTVDTPFTGFKRYNIDIKINTDHDLSAEANMLFDWAGDRIEFSSKLKGHIEYIVEVELKTPFSGFEQHALGLRWDSSEQKWVSLKALLEGPKSRIGADFDFEFNSITDFIGKEKSPFFSHFYRY